MSIDTDRKYYMDVAERASSESDATRLKVGTVIVKGRRIISDSWNGTPMGSTDPLDSPDSTGTSVLHAEEHAILKLSASSDSSEGADIYVTHSPCIRCARMIVGAKISTVYYKNYYTSKSEGCGLDYLKRHGVNLVYLGDNTQKISSEVKSSVVDISTILSEIAEQPPIMDTARASRFQKMLEDFKKDPNSVDLSEYYMYLKSISDVEEF